MTNSAQLCGQCHGNLRFPGTDHLTYNLEAGTGGIGVPDQQLMPGVSCTDCHMYSSGVDGSNSKMFGGHTWGISVPESGGSNTVSCLACHTQATDSGADQTISGFKAEFQARDATVQADVARAAAVINGTQNPAWLAAFQEAQFNLGYAESDESSGFHNHSYLMALLNDASAKALSLPILDATIDGANLLISWTGPGTLQAAVFLAGPWHDVPTPTNPLVIPRSAQAAQQFYRLRQ
jgi:hypothetical protein